MQWEYEHQDTCDLHQYCEAKHAVCKSSPLSAGRLAEQAAKQMGQSMCRSGLNEMPYG